MGLLSFAGVRPAQPGDDTLADRTLRAALAGVAVAHETLRESLRHDPFFAGVICRAMGCNHPQCLAPLPALEERIQQIPPIVDLLSEGSARVLPAPLNPITSRPAD